MLTIRGTFSILYSLLSSTSISTETLVGSDRGCSKRKRGAACPMQHRISGKVKALVALPPMHLSGHVTTLKVPYPLFYVVPRALKPDRCDAREYHHVFVFVFVSLLPTYYFFKLLHYTPRLCSCRCIFNPLS